MGFLDQVKAHSASAPQASRGTRARDTVQKVRVLKGGILSLGGKVLDDLGFTDGDYIPVSSDAGKDNGRTTVDMVIAHSADNGIIILARADDDTRAAAKDGQCRILKAQVTSRTRNNAQLNSVGSLLELLNQYDGKLEEPRELRANKDFTIKDGVLTITRNDGK